MCVNAPAIVELCTLGLAKRKMAACLNMEGDIQWQEIVCEPFGMLWAGVGGGGGCADLSKWDPII